MKYPSDKELIQHAEDIFDYNYAHHMPDDVRQGIRELALLMTKALPLFDRYRLYCESVKVSEADLREMYPQWDSLPEQLKNKIQRATAKAEADRRKELLVMADMMDAQQVHLNRMSDEQYEQIEAFADAVQL